MPKSLDAQVPYLKRCRIVTLHSGRFCIPGLVEFTSPWGLTIFMLLSHILFPNGLEERRHLQPRGAQAWKV